MQLITVFISGDDLQDSSTQVLEICRKSDFDVLRIS